MPKQVFRPLAVVFIVLAAATVWFSLDRSVQGHVRDAETGQPMPGVVVAIGGQQVVADAEGAYRVEGTRALAAIYTDAPGYEPARPTPALARLVSLQQTVDIDLKPVTLEGMVVDATTGAPVAGARVRAGAQETETDSQGHYVLKRLLPGDVISVHAPYYHAPEPVAFDGQATLDLELSLPPVTVVVRHLYGDEPLAGVTVTAGGESLQTDAQGQVTFAHVEPGSQVSATLPGMVRATAAATPGEPMTLKLWPESVHGTVRGQDGEPLASALVLLRAPGEEPRVAYTDEHGAYRLENVPAHASLLIRKAGYRRVERLLDAEVELDFVLEPFVAKGLYIPFGLLTKGAESMLQENLDLVSNSEMNAVVIDVKGDRAWLAFEPEYELAREIDAAYDGIGDIRQLLQECKRRGIYTIARIVVFKDNVLATARPEWAVKRGDGSLWKDNEQLAWTDPFRKEVWDYNLAIAKETVALGFDEIQLDYLRFPSDGDIYDMEFSQESNTQSRCQAISDFMAYMRQELDKTGAFFSADLFGMVTSVDPNMRLGDLGIGQRLIDVGPWVDYISPMVYPSMYEPGHLGLPDPWRQPYEVVKISVEDAQKQTSTLIRPWLQGYSLYGVHYGPTQHRLQMKGAADAGAHGWLIWNAGGNYDPRSFDP